MKKVIISLCVLIVLSTVLFTACKKDNENYQEGSTASAKPSESTTIPEYSTEANGEVYITNAKGEHIPVTTSKDGAMDMYDYLVTKTAEQVEKEKKEQNGGKNEGTTKQENTTASSEGIVIGTDSPDSEEHAAVIEWD